MNPYSIRGSLRPAFASARLVSLAVKPTYTFALTLRFPSGESGPLYSCVTLLQETAPVKLPSRHCFRLRRIRLVFLKGRCLIGARQVGLPPTLNNQKYLSIPTYSKAPWGLSVPQWVSCIFTANSNSPSRSLRERPSRYTFHAGH